ncbi:MAG TPA: hypothetical protein VIH99_12425 [Bdellovibrionota bacterium]
MKRVNKIAQKLVVAVLVSFLAVPVVGALANDGGHERAPAAHHEKKQKKNKKAKKAKKAKAPKSHRAQKAHHKVKKTSHAPQGSQYPTQPGAGVAEVGNEAKDDLPAPQNTEPKDD